MKIALQTTHPTTQRNFVMDQIPNLSLYVFMTQEVSMSTYITQGTLHCPLYKISRVNSFRVPMSTCITQVVSMSTYITQGTLHCPLCKFNTVVKF